MRISSRGTRSRFPFSPNIVKITAKFCWHLHSAQQLSSGDTCTFHGSRTHKSHVASGNCGQGKCFSTSDVSQSPWKLVARSIRRTSSSLLPNINEIFREVLTATQTIVILILRSWAGAGAVFMQSFVILAIIFIAPTIMVHIRRGRAGPSQGE